MNTQIIKSTQGEKCTYLTEERMCKLTSDLEENSIQYKIIITSYYTQNENGNVSLRGTSYIIQQKNKFSAEILQFCQIERLQNELNNKKLSVLFPSDNMQFQKPLELTL